MKINIVILSYKALIQFFWVGKICRNAPGGVNAAKGLKDHFVRSLDSFQSQNLLGDCSVFFLVVGVGILYGIFTSNVRPSKPVVDCDLVTP
jgi:hypothetical protein